MHRSERRKNPYITILCLVLVAALGISLVRVYVASHQVTPDVLAIWSGNYGRITTRNGDTLYDGSLYAEDLVGSLISPDEENRNSVYANYKDRLSLDHYPILGGVEALAAQELLLETTLLGLEQQRMVADAFGSKHGVCFSYNYETGEIYTMLSLPSLANTTADAVPGALQNQCLNGLFIPGSTMKVITALCALESGVDPNEVMGEYVCYGQAVLDGGTTTVTCPYNHGPCDFATALGQSCNGYFAVLAMKLGVEQCDARLKELGFTTTAAQRGTMQTMGGLEKTVSNTGWTNTEFNNAWNMVGQANTQINVIDMAVLAGAVAGGGISADPWLIAGEKTQPQRRFSAATAQYMDTAWAQAVNKYYRDGRLVEAIDYAKTGTAEAGGGTNRLLLGVISKYKVAFAIVIQDYREGDPVPFDVATALVNALNSQAP